MKCILVNSVGDKVTIADMKPGQLGIDEEGAVYYRKTFTAICLTNHEYSYSEKPHLQDDHVVTLFPVGSKLLLEVTV